MHSRILHRQDLDPSGAAIVSGTLTTTGDLVLASKTAVGDPSPVTAPPLAFSFTLTTTITGDPPASTTAPVLPTVSAKAASHNVVLPILATLGGFIALVILSILFVCKRRHARRTSSVAGSVEASLKSPSPSYRHTTEKSLVSFSEGHLEREHTTGLDLSLNTSSPDIERTKLDIPPPDIPPQYAVERDTPAAILGEKRRGKRVARDGGVLLDQGPGAEEMRRQRSVRSVRTEFSVGTVPSTSASTLPPPYGRYD